MARFGIAASVVALLLVGLLVATPGRSLSLAQEGTPDATAGHPLVGAWLLDVDTADPGNPPSLIIFHDDGTYLQADPDGSSGIGAWEPTGDQTAALTALFHGQQETGEFGGTAKVRASIEVDASGDTFTADYTLEFLDPDGASTGEMGPGAATGERITVEPMGTPTSPIQFDGAATPAA